MTYSTLEKNGEQITVKSYNSEKCVYTKKGFPFCHCNDCLNKIMEYAEFKKSQRFWYRGIKVTISDFCPLDHCCDIFIQGIEEPAFCRWLTLAKARKELKISYEDAEK